MPYTLPKPVARMSEDLTVAYLTMSGAIALGLVLKLFYMPDTPGVQFCFNTLYCAAAVICCNHCMQKHTEELRRIAFTASLLVLIPLCVMLLLTEQPSPVNTILMPLLPPVIYSGLYFCARQHTLSLLKQHPDFHRIANPKDIFNTSKPLFYRSGDNKYTLSKLTAVTDPETKRSRLSITQVPDINSTLHTLASQITLRLNKRTRLSCILCNPDTAQLPLTLDMLSAAVISETGAVSYHQLNRQGEWNMSSATDSLCIYEVQFI